MAMKMKWLWGGRVGNKTKQENTLPRFGNGSFTLFLYLYNDEIQPLGVPTLIILASYFRISPGSSVITWNMLSLCDQNVLHPFCGQISQSVMNLNIFQLQMLVIFLGQGSMSLISKLFHKQLIVLLYQAYHNIRQFVVIFTFYILVK